MAVEFVDHAACAHIAKNKGWFEEEGIKLKFYDSYITGMALAAALSRGDIDIAYICLIPAINARFPELTAPPVRLLPRPGPLRRLPC